MTTLIDIPEPVRKRLKTLLLVALTSEHPAERETAMTKFTQVAKDNGLDPHELATTLMDPQVPAPRSEPPRSEPPSPAKPKSSLRRAITLAPFGFEWEIDGTELYDWIGKIRRHHPRLSEWQKKFPSDFEEKALSRELVGLSDRQLQCFSPMTRCVPKTARN